MNKIYKVLMCSSYFLLSAAQAEVTFNGFTSIVGGITTSSDETLYGYDDSIDFSPSSLFAIQASSELGNGLNITAQVLSRGDNNWQPEVEWAYITYEANEELRILAGRQRVPFYMFSDFLDVSYAYSWITPPAGVYSVVFDTFDGLGSIYSHSLGEVDFTAHAIYGTHSSDAVLNAEEVALDFKDIFGAALTANYDWLTLRAAYFQAEMNIEFQGLAPLVLGWQQAGFNDIAQQIDISEDTGDFFELGMQVEYNNFLFISEYTKLTLSDTVFAGQNAFYFMLGKQWDSILAHVTYGEIEQEKGRLTTGVPTGISLLDQLINETNALTDGEKEKSHYVTLGLRWDFHDSAALKFEYTRFDDELDHNNDSGLLRTAIVTVF